MYLLTILLLQKHYKGEQMKNRTLTPREIVKELDAYIIGQNEAKRSLAIALRNRYRRMQLDNELQQEVTPKNLLMIGPTGVGKTELARRVAKLVDAPFVKVEATKFTEVGYVGRDVESMVRDLVEHAIVLVKNEKKKVVRDKAYRKAIQTIAAKLKPGVFKKVTHPDQDSLSNMFRAFGLPDPPYNQEEKEEVSQELASTRKQIEDQLYKGLLSQQEVTIEIKEKPMQFGNHPAMEQMSQIQTMLNQLTPSKTLKRTVKVSEAIELLTAQEEEELINLEDVHAEAIKLASTSGIIFIDEIDKIATRNQNGGEVSREGVQRDILPIVEGSQVQTKYGFIQTDHILFIASGAFHVAKPSDLMPELQGRFPIRVELEDLTCEDFVRILTEPKHSLLKQYKALLETENVEVIFTKEAIEKMAEIAFEVNRSTENIGARRLHTILEKLLEDLLFEASEMQMGSIQITQQYVLSKLESIQEDKDLSRYIL